MAVQVNRWSPLPLLSAWGSTGRSEAAEKWRWHNSDHLCTVTACSHSLELVSTKVSLGCVCLFKRAARLSALTLLTAFSIMPPVPETMQAQMAGMPRQMPHKAVPDGPGLGFICLIKESGEIAHFRDSKNSQISVQEHMTFRSRLTSFVQTNSLFDLFKSPEKDGKLDWMDNATIMHFGTVLGSQIKVWDYLASHSHCKHMFWIYSSFLKIEIETKWSVNTAGWHPTFGMKFK